MHNEQYTDLFPGRPIGTISQRDYAAALVQLHLPPYLERHRFVQFCSLKGEKPDWALFHLEPRKIKP